MSTTWNRSLRGLALSLCFVMVVAPVVRAEAVVASTGILRASVTIAGSHSPAELVTVRVVDLESATEVAIVTTDATGAIVLTDLPFGIYHVSAMAPEGFVATAGPLVTVDATAAAADVAITLAPAQEGDDQEEDEGEGDDEGEDDDDDAEIGLILLGVLGAAGVGIGIAGVIEQDKDEGAGDVITQ